ncbi:MAG TPA: UvrD-helicase domain-containing protein, partial [Geobacterales bacterium]|nr:UvrD-helicase domain-containing protein [Geobacterales bacterium]
MLDLSSLNPEQLSAVRKSDGPLLVLAGAGSGKTRVITYRIGHLLDKGVPGEQILAVTFTNKAAREMKERLRELVGATASRGVILSTFHSLCVRILRRDIELLGYKRNFSIYSTTDQLGVLRQMIREEAPDRKWDAELLLAKISSAKNRLITPERYQPRETDDYEMLAAEIYPRYQAALRAFNAI